MYLHIKWSSKATCKFVSIDFFMVIIKCIISGRHFDDVHILWTGKNNFQCWPVNFRNENSFKLPGGSEIILPTILHWIWICFYKCYGNNHMHKFDCGFILGTYHFVALIYFRNQPMNTLINLSFVSWNEQQKFNELCLALKSKNNWKQFIQCSVICYCTIFGLAGSK